MTIRSGTFKLEFNKETYQGKIFEDAYPYDLHSRVFYIDDAKDVFFPAIKNIPCSVSEKFRQEIIYLYNN
jgi:hypothetical protein